MKKREKKLQLHRETVRQLEPRDLREAAGGVVDELHRAELLRRYGQTSRHGVILSRGNTLWGGFPPPPFVRPHTSSRNFLRQRSRRIRVPGSARPGVRAGGRRSHLSLRRARHVFRSRCLPAAAPPLVHPSGARSGGVCADRFRADPARRHAGHRRRPVRGLFAERHPDRGLDLLQPRPPRRPPAATP